MKELNFKIAVLLCMMIGFSEIIYGQLPDGIRVLRVEDGIQVIFDSKKTRPNDGAAINDKIVVPCNYYFVSCTHGYIEAYLGDVTTNLPRDIYKKDGTLLFPGSQYGKLRIEEHDDGVYFYAKDAVYTESGKCIYKGRFHLCKIIYGSNGERLVEVTQKESFDGFDYRCSLYDFDGRKIIPYDYMYMEIVEGSYGEKFIETTRSSGKRIHDFSGKEIAFSDGSFWYKNGDKGEKFIIVYNGNSNKKCGLYDFSGNEILAPEFEYCEYAGENLFKFKMNGYYGVINREGKVIIPLSRQYTKIDYSRTLKTFTFEKEDGRKGECNAKGVQTSISKPKETIANNTTTTKTPSSTSNSKGTNGTSSSTSTSKATSNNNEPGLLYRGEYTISEDVGSTVEIISIYEDRIVVGGSFSFDYKSTNSKGNRVYSGNGPFGVYWRFYVSPNYNIRLTKDYPNPFGGTPTAVNCRVTKGQSSMPVQNGGEYYGGSEDYNGTSGGNKNGTSGNPVQPHQITESCPICHGSGKCNTCNGTHRYLNGLTGKYLECPNCKPDGHCTHCGGSGKVTKTKYY